MQQAVKRQRDRFAQTHPWAKPSKKTDVTSTSDTVSGTLHKNFNCLCFEYTHREFQNQTVNSIKATNA